MQKAILFAYTINQINFLYFSSFSSLWSLLIYYLAVKGKNTASYQNSKSNAAPRLTNLSKQASNRLNNNRLKSTFFFLVGWGRGGMFKDKHKNARDTNNLIGSVSTTISPIVQRES